MGSADTFQNGKIYRLLWTVTPEPGYLISSDCSLTIGGEPYSFDDSTAYQAEVRIPFCISTEQIDRVQINADELPKAEIGKSFGASVKVKETTSHTVSSSWTTMDEDGNLHTAGTFQNGGVYTLTLNIQPKDGYSLPISEWIDLQIGDEEFQVFSDQPDRWLYDIRVSYAKVITQAELLNLPTPSLGQALPEIYFDVSVPSNANYTAEACWRLYNPDTGNYDSLSADDGTNIVQRGRTYILSVYLYPKYGFEFAESLSLTAAGVTKKLYPDPDWMYYETTFSFCEQIQKVDVHIAEPVIGGHSADPYVTDANVVIQSAYWTVDWTDQASVVFQQGRDYDLTIVLTPAKGYEFAKNAEVQLNGAVQLSKTASAREIVIRKQFSFKEIVPMIRIDNVLEMKVGQNSGYGPTIPAGANYDLAVEWSVWNNQYEIYEPFDGVFEEGKVYSRSMYGPGMATAFPAIRRCFWSTDR